MSSSLKKQEYAKRFRSYLQKYSKALIVNCDNVGSKQFQDIRRTIRSHSIILMGKNTMIKKILNLYIEETGDKSWECLHDLLVGNLGIIFTNGDLNDLRAEISKFKVGAAARVGATAPCDVTVPAGGTGMDPSATSFFQALNIPTKINKGTVEIVSDVQVIKTGDKVTSSQAALLAKLGIKPFSYGLIAVYVYENGSIFDPKILDITDSDMAASAMAAIQNVAALSMATHVPTLPAVPHLLINGYKNVLAIALATDYSFPKADKVKEMLLNPGAFAVAAPAAAAAAPAAAAKKPEPESEEDEDMGFSLFD